MVFRPRMESWKKCSRVEHLGCHSHFFVALEQHPLATNVFHTTTTMSESNSLSQSSLSSLASLSQNLGNDISRNSNESSSDESFDDAVDDQILVIIVEELVEINNNSWGGSKPGKSPNKQRDFEGQYARLVQQYFSGDNSVYNETKMVTSKSLLLVLAVNCLEAVDMLLLLLSLSLFYEKSRWKSSEPGCSSRCRRIFDTCRHTTKYVMIKLKIYF